MKLESTPSGGHLPPRLVWFMAIASGATVMNLYFNQPLLEVMGRELKAPPGLLPMLSTLTQVGYALGMLLIVPLGDGTERRRLTVICAALVSVALIGLGASPSFFWCAAMCLLVGLTTVVPQLIIPFAANLAAATERGHVVGTIMSGLLIGILLSRTLAGFVGEMFGWRVVFFGAAGLMVCFAVLLRVWLPTQSPERALSYGALLKSLVTLFREEPSLRVHAFLGAMSFGAFSAFWATLSLYLASFPEQYGPSVTGWYGLIGIAGAAIAPLVGRYADRRGDRKMNALALATLLLSFVLLYPLGSSLVGIAVCVVLLDMGAQANQIANQARVYALRPDARSRLNTIYMFTYFVGGALGAALGGWAWNTWRWFGVCFVAAAMSATALAVLFIWERRARLGGG